MKLSDFDYNLSSELVAQFPLEKREDAKLLVIDRKRKKIIHKNFNQLGEFLRKDDLLVLNDSKVVNCRLLGKRATGGKAEVFILKHIKNFTYECLLRPARLRIGERIFFDKGISAIIKDRRKVSFSQVARKKLYSIGKVPLPPSIKRAPLPSDSLYYQTVYAKKDGSVASPTAGLHFSKIMIKDLKSQGIKFSHVTLHVGYGTFSQVKTDNIRSHKMHSECYSINSSTFQRIEDSLLNKKRVIAVGTTGCRVLESCSRGKLKGETDIFIYPGYRFKRVSALITNFHLPRTTLFMLVCAFGGTELIKKAYRQAIKRKYRFYSYGDAMIII